MHMYMVDCCTQSFLLPKLLCPPIHPHTHTHAKMEGHLSAAIQIGDYNTGVTSEAFPCQDRNEIRLDRVQYELYRKSQYRQMTKTVAEVIQALSCNVSHRHRNGLTH